MAGASAIRAGSAYVELFTKNNPLVAGLKAAEAKVKAFGNAIAGIGTKFALLGSAIFAPLLGAAKQFADSGSELLLMSQRTGLTVEALSALKFAAGQAGVSAEELEVGLKKMSQTVQKAADGNHEAIRSLQSLGVTVSDIKDLAPDKIFERLATGVAGIQNPTTRAARTLEVFGKSGLALLPLLNRGAAGIEELRKEAERLGLVKTLEGVQSAFKLQLAMKAAGKSIESVWNAVGGAIAPVITSFAEGVVPFIGQVRQWVKENKALFTTLLTVGGAVLAIGTALLTVGGAFKFIAMAIAPIVAIVSLVFTVVGGLFSAVVGYISLLATPFGLLLVFLNEAKSVLIAVATSSVGTFDTLKRGFSDVAGVATTAWGAVSDMIAAGDWAGAINTALLGVRVVFQTAVAALSQAWRDFSGFFIDTFHAAVTQIAVLLEKLEAGFQAVKNRISGKTKEDEAQADFQMQQARRLARDVQAYRAEHGANAPLSADLENRRIQIQQGIDATSDRLARENPTGAGVQANADRDQAERQRQRDVANAADQARIRELQAEIAKAAEDASNTRVIAEQQRWVDSFGKGNGPEAGLDESRTKTDVKGTFSSFAVAGLGASSLQERMANGIDQIAHNTDPERNQQGFS